MNRPAAPRRQLGEKLATRVRDIAIQIYKRAATYALERGIIIADTKFEFGTDEQGRLYIIDEMLTPDSSRFWPVDGYAVGISPPSFDKQFVRDYLETDQHGLPGVGSQIKAFPDPAGFLIVSAQPGEGGAITVAAGIGVGCVLVPQYRPRLPSVE